MLNDLQIHTVPENQKYKNNIAKLMNYINWDDLDIDIKYCLSTVIKYFNRLTRYGIKKDAFPVIKASILPTQKKYDTTSLAQSFINSHLFNNKVNEIITEVSIYIKPYLYAERIFRDFLALLDSAYSTDKHYIFSYLIEERVKIPNLIKVFSLGKNIRKTIIKNTFLLESALNMKHLNKSRFTKKFIRKRLTQRLREIDISNQSDYLELLKQYRLKVMLYIVIHRCFGLFTTMQMSDYLTNLAEIICHEILNRSFEDVIAVKKTLSYCKQHIAIIAYGKTAGYEMSLLSDIDVVFIHNLKDNDIQEKKLLFKVVQRFVFLMGLPTQSGKLYDIDLRLRPDGNTGHLLVSAIMFKRYQLHKAWIWEHQALTRARCIFGDKTLREDFQSIRLSVLTQKRDQHNLVHSITSMRKKMRNNDKHNLLRSLMIDIEFIAQFLALSHSYHYPMISYYGDTIRIIESAETARIIKQDIADSLIHIYKKLRLWQFKKFLQEDDQEENQKELNVYATKTAQYWCNVFKANN